VDLAALTAHLKALQKAAGDAAPPAATAMAEAVKYQIQNVALKQVAHAPGMFFKAAPMRPPAYASGTLSRSIIMRPASGTITGTAYVAATALYAGVQEFGSERQWPSHGKYMKWTNSGGTWYKKETSIPPHPYFRPTVDRMIRNGDLSRAAQQAFLVRVLPYLRG
jgi:hypothetical protein